MKNIFIALIILKTNVSIANICTIENPYLKSKVSITDTPNYFFRTFPDTNSVSYNGGGTNYILNLDTGVKTSMPGKYDPVPTWDERMITTPNNGMAFYDVNKLLSGADEPLIFEDSAHVGVYQSIASLNSDGSQIRVITDAGGVTAKDYLIAYERDGSVSINPMAPKRKLCPDERIKLPMISKDGLYLAARDMNFSPPTSRVYRIEDDGSCTLIKDLGVEAGKVDFSFDGKELTFHKGVSETSDVDYWSTSSWVQDVYVYNFETDSTKKITNNSQGKTSYYPVWKRNGDIVYIDKAEDGSFSFSLADPKKLDQDSSTINTVDESYLIIIGEVWTKRCVGVDRQDDHNSFLTALSMSKASCKVMIDEEWSLIKEKSIERGIEAKRGKFYSVCPDINISVPRTEPIPRPVNPVKVIQRKCNVCHGNIVDLLNTNISTHQDRTWLDEAVLRMNSQDETYKMPKGSSLSADEIREVTNYLEQFRAK